MFKHAVIASCLLLVLAAAGLIYYIQGGKEKDRLAYQRLMDQGSAEGAPAVHQVKQKRERVSKDLFFADAAGRRHLHMEGEKADLLLHREEDQAVLMESLQSVACAFQEELIPDANLQSVVWFDAAKAHLNYRTHLLEAEDVAIARYRLSGRDLPEKKPKGQQPLLEGRAGVAEIAMEGKSPKIRAKTFRGRMLLEGKQSKIAEVEADEAAYESGKLLFLGSVQVHHPLGTLKARKAEVSSGAMQGAQRYTNARFDEGVDISLNYGGHLHCAHAALDGFAKKAVFESSQEDSEVVYTDVLLDSKGNQVPLIFKSAAMSMQLDSGEAGRKPQLSHLTADHQVSLNYNREMTLTADHADYLFRDDPGGKKTLISGFVILKGNAERGICQLTNLQGDYVRAERIELSTLQSTAVLHHPDGSFQTLRSNGVCAPITFQGEKLALDYAQDLATLEKSVVVKDSEYGTIATDGTLTLRRASGQEGKKSLQSITSTGKTLLTHAEADRSLTHTLLCEGTVKLDHASTTFDCSAGPEESQVLFEDAYGEVKAKRATLVYKYEGGKIVPHKLILDGDLRVINRTAAADTAHPVQLQYALADHAEYLFATKEMTFSANPKKKVLLYDKSNHIEISAPALKIKRDGATKKDSITGEGDVRFHLVEHELNQIKNHFRFES